jgi:heme/copper-type cytochrome/quinol oxidase subunit 2
LDISYFRTIITGIIILVIAIVGFFIIALLKGEKPGSKQEKFLIK